jgi:prepilin-type N-terminal cleavage/methylation domain-containing protein
MTVNLPAQHAIRRRAGFTLLEVVLVVAVIAVIIGITWPPLMRYAAQQELGDSVLSVRHELAGCRVKAIDNGLVYQFRYEPGGRYFAALPFDRPDVGNARTETSVTQVTTTKSPPVVLQKLPESIRFFPKPSQPVEQLAPEWKAMLSKTEPIGTVSWSVPLLFFMDGTSDNATVIVEDKRGNSQTLTLRGLTGAVYSGPIIKGQTK